jgi:hypothetical protein
MHCTVQPGRYCIDASRTFPSISANGNAPLEKLGEFCGTALVVSRRKPLLVVGMLRKAKTDDRAAGVPKSFSL